MGRAKNQKRRAAGPGKGTQRQPTALPDGSKGRGVIKRIGTERPDPATHNPTDIADPVARVIKTNS